ncbi:MAG TPA: MBL fold metallo-hydrolase, partial [Roseiflexaceae bacterium]|nr:MBL fold metallo-hydrolase [Roseiflexaceae bacterium]
LPGVVIYAPHHEAPLIEHPLLEPIYLHNGAHPWSALQTKWLMARGSPVDHRIDTGMLTIANVELEILPLAGHSLAQIGIAVDGVCFAADGFFGTDVLQKHGIPYAHDIKAQIDSLERLAQRREHFFLPGHGPLTPRAALAETISANRHAIETTTRIVLAALAEPADLASIARRVRHAAGYTFAGIPQYAIFTSVIAAYLSYLEAGGQAGATLTDAGIIWRRLSAYTQ